MKILQILIICTLSTLNILPSRAQQAASETATQATSEAASPAIAKEAAANPAKIYLYRPKSPIGMTVVYAVFVNDKQVGVARNGFNHIYEVSEPGAIEIWGETEKKLSISIDVEPGKVYYVKCGVKMGALTGRPKFTLMDQKKGKQAYNKLI